MWFWVQVLLNKISKLLGLPDFVSVCFSKLLLAKFSLKIVLLYSFFLVRHEFLMYPLISHCIEEQTFPDIYYFYDLFSLFYLVVPGVSVVGDD